MKSGIYLLSYTTNVKYNKGLTEKKLTSKIGGNDLKLKPYIDIVMAD